MNCQDRCDQLETALTCALELLSTATLTLTVAEAGDARPSQVAGSSNLFLKMIEDFHLAIAAGKAVLKEVQ